MTIFPHTTRKWQKNGFIYKPENLTHWWKTHAMAPTCVALDDEHIRIFVGGWDSNNISRIGYLDAQLPTLSIIGSSQNPIVDIGRPGAFDDNGVFPGHATKIDRNEVLLYFTGFQKSTKPEVDHFNFSGLSISSDKGMSFVKVSEAPVLDRSDEGLYVRAGLSVYPTINSYLCVYSAGSEFLEVGGKLRPKYEIFLQENPSYVEFKKKGKKIIQINPKIEHGLGRPQITTIDGIWYVFYTRRTLDMYYKIGCAYSVDLETWTRIDSWVDLGHGAQGEFDSQMFYFPSIIQIKNKIYMIYCGNGFGRTGLGFAELL